MTQDEQDLNDELVGDHAIPRRPSEAALKRAVVVDTEHAVRRIREYVEIESGERVIHAEKIKSEHVSGDDYEVWDVHTEQDRYWVITNLTNLYSQSEFPSLDYTLSLHIGLMFRMAARSTRAVPDEQTDRLAAAWRRWQQAAEALDHADEVEAFQAVGARCRECLLSLVRSVAREEMIRDGEEKPKAGAFVLWIEAIVEFVAAGEPNKDLRGYLKSSARAAWQLTNWLIHSTAVSRIDGGFVVDATRHVLESVGAAIVRFERGAPAQCPKCASYRLVSDYRPDLDIDPPYVTLCESCDWADPPQGRVPPDEDYLSRVRRSDEE